MPMLMTLAFCLYASRALVVGAASLAAGFSLLFPMRHAIVDALLAPSRGQWGTSLVVLGFILIPLGVVLHKKLSRVLAVDELRAGDATEASPATSAAISGA
jgi:hypothetical protein